MRAESRLAVSRKGMRWVVALALCSTTASASSFTLRAEVDARKVGLEDQVQLTIVVEGSGAPDTLPLPNLTNLQVVGGPFQSSQVSIVNGRMSQSRNLTYLLKPRSVGKAEVGAVTAGDQTTSAIPIEVVAGSIRPQPSRRGRDPFSDPFGDTGGDPFEELLGQRRGRVEPKLMIEAVPSRARLRVGEPLVLTYYLYTQVPVADLRFETAPQYAGFWVEDLEREKSPSSGEPATVGGESYRRFPMLRKLLFPTKAGALTLSAASMRIAVPRQGFFDAGAEVTRSTRPVTITVDALPDAPGFSGAVGRFRASALLDRDSVGLGGATTLRFRIEGTGNLKWIDRAPSLEVKGAKVYPPQTKSDLKPTPQGISGSRTWEFVVVPETTGILDLPTLAFSYFDPDISRIVTAETRPISLRVDGGSSAAVAEAPVALNSDRPTSGALPLRIAIDRPGMALPALNGRAVAAIAALVLVLHAAIGASSYLRGVLGGRGRPTPSRSLKAAHRDLARVGKQPMSKEQAAVLIEKALHEAFGEIAATDDDERARSVRALLDQVRFVRFAPQLGDYSEKTRDLAARADEAVRRWA